MIVAHDDDHSGFNCFKWGVLGKGRLLAELVEPGANDSDGVVGVDVIIHQVSVCSEEEGIWR